ncbi:hypothetical protein SUGI_0328630 [Cryptomeria japonica]|nr:hypothetical protein SUGI_0328630 [Cryptomeria japonica]
MPGEDPFDLWEANQMSFKKAKLLMKNGCDKGKSSEEINSIFCIYSLQWAEDGMRLLNMFKKLALPSVSKHFPCVEEQSVKMTVVSLITIFIRLHKAKSDHLKKIMKACGEVWDLLTFVDECDIDLDANKMVLLDDLNRDKDQVRMAADSEFYKLQMEYAGLHFGCEGARRCVENLFEENEGLLKQENLLGDCKEKVAADLNDSKDWIKIAPSYSLYKLCKVMLDGDIEDFVEWTEESLRNVIAFSMSRLPDMLVKQCWKWAKEFKEDKLWESIHLAGKCRGMMEAWGLEPQSTSSSTKQRRIQVTLSNQVLADF